VSRCSRPVLAPAAAPGASARRAPQRSRICCAAAGGKAGAWPCARTSCSLGSGRLPSTPAPAGSTTATGTPSASSSR